MRIANTKENSPLVSVIITCYNCEKTILKAIESVIDQSYTNLEIIVVDDFSKDQSRDVLLKVSDPRLQFIFLPKNSGVSGARNAGYRKATGDFVTQLDGDDFIHPEKIENEVSVAVQSIGAAVFSRFEVIKNGRIACKLGDLMRKSSVVSFRGILYRTEYLGRDWLIPASVLSDLNFDEERSLYEDWDFALYVARRASVIYVDRIGTYYVKSQGTLSSRPWRYQREALNSVFSDQSQSKFARLIFSTINRNQYLSKVFSLILNWTRLYKVFPT